MTQIPNAAPQPSAPTPPAPPPVEVEQDPEARTMGMLCHLLGIFTGFIGPLVIWLMKKDQMPFVNDQGKEALNWQITLLFAWVIAGATSFICIGLILMPLIGIATLVLGIMGTVKANNGVRYRYPFAIRLIK